MVHSIIIITDIATNQVMSINLSLLHFDGKNVNKQLMIYYCFFTICLHFYNHKIYYLGLIIIVTIFEVFKNEGCYFRAKLFILLFWIKHPTR